MEDRGCPTPQAPDGAGLASSRGRSYHRRWSRGVMMGANASRPLSNRRCILTDWTCQSGRPGAMKDDGWIRAVNWARAGPAYGSRLDGGAVLQPGCRSGSKKWHERQRRSLEGRSRATSTVGPSRDLTRGERARRVVTLPDGDDGAWRFGRRRRTSHRSIGGAGSQRTTGRARTRRGKSGDR